MEATIRLVWKDEVQVRVPSGALLWRTVRTVRATASPVAKTRAAPPAECSPIIEAGDATEQNAGETALKAVAAPEPLVDAEATVVNTGAAETVGSIQPDTSAAAHLACGVPEVEAERKEAKQGKKRNRRR